MLKIEIQGGKTNFLPGEKISGMAMWQVEKPPQEIEVRLFWYTSGKGTQDIGLVDTVRFTNPTQSNARAFKLELPVAPYSFSGSIISLIWALELVVEPSGETERMEVTVSPSGKEILLHESS